METNDILFSKYNCMFNSKKYGYFIYNSVTNSFFKINKDLFQIFHNLKDNPTKITELNQDVLNQLIKAKILVSEYEDNSYITKKQYIAYSDSFSSDVLGLVIVPTMDCNFACPYCYEHNLPKDKMTTNVQDKIVEFINRFEKAKNNVAICWHGGEPLVAFDVMNSLLDKLYSSENITIIQHDLVTNGYLLDLKKINTLKKFNLDGIQITIDGTEATHNLSRPLKSGKPTYNKIIDNVDLFVDEFPQCHVKIRINIHQYNMKDFSKLHEELSARWKGKNLGLYMVYVSDNEHCKVKCIRLKEKVVFLRELYQKEGISDIQFFPKVQDYGCAATNQNTFIVGPAGELYKCWVDVGNKKRIIGNLDEGITDLTIVSEYMIGSSMFNDKKCENCILLPICDGGCNLFRFENRMYGKDYDVCPIDLQDLSTLLELHYEKNLHTA
ncbi:MAG: SPASM domain-containing protein [Bacteroidales bacterium]|nr:SPASM domain-containing protein [Acholeplasmataceae bacterium]MCK9449846.1 SPASM domain-containing protein [Bacteroidales bacterium]